MLTLDINCAVRGPLTPGVDLQDADDLGEQVSRCVADLASPGPWKGWVDLPLDASTAHAAVEYARDLPRSIREVAILGIGGSSLGPLALYHAATHPLGARSPRDGSRSRRLHFMDNSDPDTVGTLMDDLEPENSLFVVITKSGSTAETASQLLTAWERVRAGLGEAASDHFVFITDPARGDLRALAGRLGVRTFDVPPDVGGRFSILSAVGLVPAALAGLDPVSLLDGARRVREACLRPDVMSNPAALLATVAFLLDERHGRNVHVIMPYSDRLAPLGAWFRQIWAESLGKPRDGRTAAGPTPVDARGATDQHSLLQLIVDGPPDKFVIFVDVASRREVVVPALFGDLSSFGYLGGQSLSTLITAELRGTRMSLARAGTPSVTLGIDEVSPAAMGALFYLMEVATAVAGSLYGVDPYDQPGVEEGKRLACGLLGREGFEDKRTEAEAFERSMREDLVVEV